MNIIYKPIGTIHTPFKDLDSMPIQSSAARGVKGTIELLSEFCEGLKDLDGFSHLILLYHFHCAGKTALQVIPFLDKERRGVFATRAPVRPNAIGLSVVRLLSISENILAIEDVDILDGTPLLDIKPYVPMFDQHDAERIGWLSRVESDIETQKSDDRFKK